MGMGGGSMGMKRSMGMKGGPMGHEEVPWA